MRVLVTGSRGFIGKNLIASMKEIEDIEIQQFDITHSHGQLEQYTHDCDFVIHLAGVNRPDDNREFMRGNYDLTSELIGMLKSNHNTCPVLYASSIQAELNNPYAESKKAAENFIFEYAKETGVNVLVYRFPNIFGKWCRPNYNSVVATFCHSIAMDIPIKINDSSVIMNLVYIDDVVNEICNAIIGNENRIGQFCKVSTEYHICLGKIADLIKSFRRSREERTVPAMADPFTKKLYSTYLSYLPENQFSYELKTNEDNRGSFTEVLRTPDRGQVSVNISKPGIVKGNHWHHTKTEKFLVVSGKGVIRFREINSDKIVEYFVSDEKMEVVDIPVGYTHNIENIGDTDMVTVMWANESFDPKKPDTYYLEV